MRSSTRFTHVIAAVRYRMNYLFLRSILTIYVLVTLLQKPTTS